MSEELDDSIDEGLANRTAELAADLMGDSPAGIELGTADDPEDSFAQVIGPGGELIDSTSQSLPEPVLDAEALAAAGGAEVGTDVGQLPGVDGDARLLARAVEVDGERYVVVAGVATQDRDETLSGLVATFAIGAPIALLLASLAGYFLATGAMRPVERMRLKAREITLDQDGERLPLPAAEDEIHRLGSTLNEMLARIERSLERQRAFVADASHELRTPLAILKGELELGKRPDRSIAEARAAIASAEEEVERLQSLTDDLLTLARSDGKSLPIERTEAAVPALLEGLRARFAPRARAENREVTIGAAEPERFDLDAGRVEGALANLIENAMRHGAGEITLSARSDADAVVFDVTDEGPGFPPGFGEEAFERFARAEGGRTSSGYGLGLAIVRAIADAHGGSVAIDSGAAGARVILRIPSDSQA